MLLQIEILPLGYDHANNHSKIYLTFSQVLNQPEIIDSLSEMIKMERLNEGAHLYGRAIELVTGLERLCPLS